MMEGQVTERPRSPLPAVPWTMSDIVKSIGMVLGLFIVILVATFIAVLLIAVGMLYGSGGIEPESIEQLLTSAEFMQRVVLVSLIASVLMQGAIFFGAWFFSLRKYKCGWRALGFHSFEVKRALIFVPVALVLAILVNLIYEWVLTSFGVELSPSLPPEFTQGIANMAIVSSLAIFVAPFAEETFFRGFLFAGISERFGYVWGALLSALLFGFLHFLTSLQWSVFLPIFLLGIILAWLYFKTGSLWPCVITHFVYNLLAILLTLLLP